jgi:hypothetical protein
MSDDPTPLRDIHAMMDQAGIAPGSLAARVASALADLAAWQAKADALAVNLARTSSVRDEAITERNAAWREAADLRVTLGRVREQRDAAQQVVTRWSKGGGGQ